MNAPRRLAAIALTCSVLAGCGAGGDPAPAPSAPNLAGSGCLTASAGGTKVAFTAADGAHLVGIELGRGRTGVVLAHSDGSSLCEWLTYGKQLAGRGYRVLAFDFTGEGDSGPAEGVAMLSDEVVAAAASMRSRGVTDVVLMGASKGGSAVVAGAPAIDPAPRALVSLSAPARWNTSDAIGAAPKLTSPVLYVAGEADAGFAGSAKELHDATPAAARRGLLVTDGPEHGTALLGGTSADRVTKAIDELLAKEAPPAA